MNKRQAKKKRKKDEQQRVDLYATIADLPAIARKIGEVIKEALDWLREALSEINVEEVCKQIKEQEAEHGTN